MAWYKDKPDDFYELASSVSDLNESLYKDYICLWWAGKSGGREYDRGTSGVPVLVDGDIVTLAVNEDYPRLETLRNIPNPGQYHKSTFEIRRYPTTARYASSADKLSFWAKQFNGSKIRLERYHKISKGKLYQIQINTEEFGDYCCRVTFKVYDENKRCEFTLDETNNNVRDGAEFYQQCKDRILEAYPECPLFNRPMELLPRGWRIVEEKGAKVGMPETWEELNQKFGEKAVGQAIADSIKRRSALCEKKDEQEKLTYQEIIEKAKKAKENFLAKKEELSDSAADLYYGLAPHKLKGQVKSLDIKEDSKEVKGDFFSSTWKNILTNTLVCVKNDGTEFTSTIEELSKQFDFYKKDLVGKSLVKVKNKWDELLNLFNSYKRWQHEAALAKSHLDHSTPKPHKRGFDIERFDSYDWHDARQVGAAWAEISQHKDWQKWIQDNVKSISARAPEVRGKLKKARDFLGHDKVYPADTWGWSFAITFDKDKLDECPFKHLLSSDGRLCSVATVCALFRGESYENLFTSRDEGVEEAEFEEEE